ncbi:hypothetical protein HPB50_024239 [Hyalomma asiaticum]|uniref:Uncharacterized protein n=1 Tax=Hyalomma asiaticum TaxID=266040 RepID=A0ACB7TMM1_HYAAI|nr:hypothetical protein HPB50_024239 [Hyalomma asiaticum]
MAARLPNPSVHRIPRRERWNVALYVDIDSVLYFKSCERLLFQRSKDCHVDVFPSEVRIPAVTLSPHSDECALISFLERIEPTWLKSLRVRNCLLACPDRLLQCIPQLVNLVELDCVNCQMSPSHLFAVLPRSLGKLSWSVRGVPIVDANSEENALRRGTHVTGLRAMYVEMSGSLTGYRVLLTIVERCVNLKDLHVHAVTKHQYLAINACAEFVSSSAQRMASFTYTSQYYPALTESSDYFLGPIGKLHRTYFHDTIKILGNVAYGLAPDAECTCVHLEEIFGCEKLQAPDDQLLLLIEDHERAAPAMLKDVAERPWWSSYRSLAIASLRRLQPTAKNGEFWPLITACVAPLRTLLAASTNLVELNLTLCHFDRGIDWDSVATSGTVLKIRAIAIAQCALKTAASVKRLAASCPLLEELDVRTPSISRYPYLTCTLCRATFYSFNEGTMETLREMTRLQRLTLCDIPDMGSLYSLSQVKVEQLRLSWPPVPSIWARSIRLPLHVNECLHSLTLRPWNADGTDVCTELYNVAMPSLRALTIISNRQLSPDGVETLIYDLLKHLRALEILHLHLSDDLHLGKNVTWIRENRVSERRRRLQRYGGALLFGAPCFRDCSMDTFIGLVKPQD